MPEDKTIVMFNDSLLCTNCGDRHFLIYPLGPGVIKQKINDFEKRHSKCMVKTWDFPKVDQSLPIHKKVAWWLLHGEQGMSNKTMLQCFYPDSLIPTGYSNHPHDPDDFRRCHLFFETFPEFKKNIQKLSGISEVWAKLVQNWDKLTDMLLEQMKTNKDTGMYDLMKELGCEKS